MKYGRTDDEWDELVAAGIAFLEERARMPTTTSYTETNIVLARRTGLRAFDFQREDERAAMGYLLGRITCEKLPEVGAMLSSLVQYLNDNDAGPGFFELAREVGRLSGRVSAEEKLTFWSDEVSRVHDHY